jgi:hypothetical protein
MILQKAGADSAVKSTNSPSVDGRPDAMALIHFWLLSLTFAQLISMFYNEIPSDARTCSPSKSQIDQIKITVLLRLHLPVFTSGLFCRGVNSLCSQTAFLCGFRMFVDLKRVPKQPHASDALPNCLSSSSGYDSGREGIHF